MDRAGRLALVTLTCLAAWLGLVALAWPQAALACGADSDCLVAGGGYRIRMPTAAKPVAGGVPAIMFFHGWQASPAEAMADRDLAALGERLGVAVIAPEGRGKTWSYPGSPGQLRDEFAFVDAVLRDVAPRFGLDPRRILATGFSQGGSMVWWLACRMPERFAVFAPVAGAFWEPLPARCASPMPTLLHVHGTSDATVPMSGRWIGSQWKQGDVRKSFAILGGGCPPLRPQPVVAGEILACEQTGPCGESKALQLCLHKGGHDFDPAWVGRAWRQAVALGLL